MDCYLRRLKQELVRAERAPGARRTAPPRRYLAPAAGPGAGSERVEEGQRGGDGPAEGRACPEGKGREETWSQDLCERDRPEQGTETEQPKPRLKCAQRRRGRHGGHPRRRTAAGTARGAAERAGQEGRGEQGRARGREGSRGPRALGELAPPGAPSPAGLGRAGAAAGAGRAGCLPGLVCQQGGGLAAGRAGEGPAPKEGRRLADRERSCGGPARCLGWARGVRRELAEARSTGVGRSSVWDPGVTQVGGGVPPKLC